MKRSTNNIWLVLISLFFFCRTGYAQTEKISREKWQQEMQAEELRITEYTNLHLKDPVPQEVKDRLAKTEEHEHVSAEQKKQMMETLLKDHYRQQYFQLHSEAAKIYNPGRAIPIPDKSNTISRLPPDRSIMCNGNFEDGDLSAYTAFVSTYSYGICSFVPPTSVSYPSIPIMSSPNDFMLTNNVPDPLIPALNQTNGGSAHAIRLNAPEPCPPNSGIDMLQRGLPALPSGRYQVNFSYALVMESYHEVQANVSPFFVARVLNSAGTEVGSRICRLADISNPFYQVVPGSVTGSCRTYLDVVWRDWTCASIEFDAVQGDQYTLEFFMADCGLGAHFGYAYIDDICAELCCPQFKIRDCCGLQGGGIPSTITQDQTIMNILSIYKGDVEQEHGPGSADPACCDPCLYPDDPFYVFVIDEFGSVVPTSDYTIDWSHDPGNHTAVTTLLADQKTIVTITSKDGFCVWTDSFLRTCCKDTGEIFADGLTWDPCDNRQIQITLKVKDPSGTVLTSAAGYTFHWVYAGGSMTSTSESITLFPLPTQLPVYVTVIDPTTGCISRDTFDLYCCTATVPTNTGCWNITGGKQLFWDPVPNAAYYKVKINVNDRGCGCSELNPTSTIILDVYGTSTVIPSSLATCFSWQVASICPDSSMSSYSTKICSCTTPSTCSAPTGLGCQLIFTQDPVNPNMMIIQRQLYWSAVSGALSYELDMYENDPTCCGTVLATPMGTMMYIGANSYITPSLSSCFSWRVRSVCPGGKSAWSTRVCSCASFGINLKTSNEGENKNAAVEDLFGPNAQNIKVTSMPNPATDYIDFTVQFDNKEYKDLTLSIFDLNGREIAHENVVNGEVIKMDVRKYSPGMYLYVVREQGRVFYSSKILIQK